MLSSAGCQHMMDIPDFCPKITLPASGDGYAVCTVSKREFRIPKEQWRLQQKTSIHLNSQDFSKIKKAFLKACNTTPCKQAVGTFDDLFLLLDDTVNRIYTK